MYIWEDLRTLVTEVEEEIIEIVTGVHLVHTIDEDHRPQEDMVDHTGPDQDPILRVVITEMLENQTCIHFMFTFSCNFVVQFLSFFHSLCLFQPMNNLSMLRIRKKKRCWLKYFEVTQVCFKSFS